MRLVTRHCDSPDNRARLREYYTRCTAQDDFNVLAHAARIRRGIAIQHRIRRSLQGPAALLPASPCVSVVATDAAFDPRYCYDETTDEIALPSWHPDHPHYAGP